MSTIDKVNCFLEAFKSEIAKSGLIFVPRKKNTDFLAFQGMFTYQAEEVIKKLTAVNYFEGPMPDDDGSEGEVWKFAIDIQGIETYIKLKLSSGEAKCISFHKLERQITFPFG